MAKRKRLEPARLTDPKPAADAPAPRTPLASRPPIADVAQDAAASAALAEVAGELTAARTEGRLIQRLPLDSIDDDYLVRDRSHIDPAEMDALVTSLRARGQQAPIEVADLGNGRYGLISGWRRVAALRQIAILQPSQDTVLALIRQPAEAADAYVAMVEENEIRAGLSFYERARIVVRAVEAGVYPNTKTALSGLFSAIPRARRSKIGSFVTLVTELDGHLRFPEALSEKQGLTLVKALREQIGHADDLRAALRHRQPESAAEEAHVIAAPMLYGADMPSQSDVQTPLRESVAPVSPSPALMVTQAKGKIVLTGTRLSDPEFVDRLKAAIQSLE